MYGINKEGLREVKDLVPVIIRILSDKFVPQCRW
jgi:hypothetical protein